MLVITSGANRVDEKKVAALLSDTLAKVHANFVREQTGFVISGVPPVAHANPGAVLMDEDLLRFDRVFPADGTPHAVFAIEPAALLKLSGARAGSVKVGAWLEDYFRRVTLLTATFATYFWRDSHGKLSDRGREGLWPCLPSGPYVLFSRLRLSSR